MVAVYLLSCIRREAPGEFLQVICKRWGHTANTALEEAASQVMRNMEQQILFEDREIIVCHKPAGMAVQSAGVGRMDLESALKNYLGSPQLYVVHRLDQPVEGVIVFAKTQAAAGELSRQISCGKMKKEYLAVTTRRTQADQGTLENELKKDGRTNTSYVVKKGTPGAKTARLSYEIVKELCREADNGAVPRYLVRIHLDTGRHHQIRVQMAHAGMPLAGDRKYHPEDSSGLTLGLCAVRLGFFHPKTKKYMEFETVPQGNAFLEL